MLGSLLTRIENPAKNPDTKLLSPSSLPLSLLSKQSVILKIAAKSDKNAGNLSCSLSDNFANLALPSASCNKVTTPLIIKPHFTLSRKPYTAWVTQSGDLCLQWGVFFLSSKASSFNMFIYFSSFSLYSLSSIEIKFKLLIFNDNS